MTTVAKQDVGPGGQGQFDPLEPEWQSLHRVADKEAKRLARTLRDNLAGIRESVSEAELVALIREGNIGRVVRRVDFQRLLGQSEADRLLAQGVKDLTDRYASIIHAGARAAADHVEGGVDFIEAQPRFDLDNPFVERAARNRAGTLISNITDESRQAIRTVLQTSMQQGRGVDVTADIVKNTVGLTRRQAQAVARFRQGLDDAVMESQGEYRLQGRDQLARQHTLSQLPKTTEAARRNAEQVTRDYADRLLTRRSLNIGRTESMTAANMGQQELWESMGRQGIIDVQTARKVFRVTPDSRLCPQCLPLEGKTVGFREPFVSDTVGLAPEARQPRPPTTVQHPPVHVACRCVVELVTDPAEVVRPQVTDDEARQLAAQAREHERRRRSLNV